MDGWTVGRMDGRTDGRMDGLTEGPPSVRGPNVWRVRGRCWDGSVRGDARWQRGTKHMSANY
eukprot:8624313-Lingulodinium_polyedra.AAC.1